MSNTSIGFTLSVIGVDGKPVVGAHVHFNIENSLDEDMYTDEQGKISIMLPEIKIVSYTLSHGLYQGEGHISLFKNEPERHNKTLNFTGYKVLEISLDCPGLPDEAKPALRLDEGTCTLKTQLKKAANQKWEGALYTPETKQLWIFSGDNIEAYADQVTIKGDTKLTTSIPVYHPVMLELENASAEKYCAFIYRNGLRIGEYKLGKMAYLWKKGEHTLLLKPIGRNDLLEASAVHFEVSGDKETVVCCDYAALSKKEKVKIEVKQSPVMTYRISPSIAPKGCLSTINKNIGSNTTEIELPIGEYDISILSPIQYQYSLEVKEGVENKLLIDMSDWKKITYETEKATDIFLLNEKGDILRCIGMPTGTFYVPSGTYTLTTDLFKPTPSFTVGDKDPEKIILPPPGKDSLIIYGIYDHYSNPLPNATVMLDGKKLSYSYPGYYSGRLPYGEYKLTITCPGFEDYTEMLQITKEKSSKLGGYGTILFPKKD